MNIEEQIEEIKKEYESFWCNGATLEELEKEEGADEYEELLVVKVWEWFEPYLSQLTEKGQDE